MGLSELVLLNTASILFGLTAGFAIELASATEDPLPTVDLPALRLAMRNDDGVSGATMMTLEIDAVQMERSENRLVGTVDVGFTLTMPHEGVDPTVRLIESAAGAKPRWLQDGGLVLEPGRKRVVVRCCLVAAVKPVGLKSTGAARERNGSEPPTGVICSGVVDACCCLDGGLVLEPGRKRVVVRCCLVTAVKPVYWRGRRAQWLRTPRPPLSVRQVWWKPAVV